jgi:hypothetical protein
VECQCERRIGFEAEIANTVEVNGGLNPRDGTIGKKRGKPQVHENEARTAKTTSAVWEDEQGKSARKFEIDSKTRNRNNSGNLMSNGQEREKIKPVCPADLGSVQLVSRGDFLRRIHYQNSERLIAVESDDLRCDECISRYHEKELENTESEIFLELISMN